MYWRVVITRQCLEPLRLLTIKEFAESSQSTITREERIAVDAANNNQPFRKQYPIEAAADLTLINEFRSRSDMMLTRADLWDDLIDDTEKTFKTNSYIYKLLSSLEAGVEELHAEPNQQSPVMLFRSCQDGAWQAEVLGLPECRQTQFHKDHIAQALLEPDGLLGKVAMAKRRHIASLIRMDIKRVESLHAAMRRRQRMQGQQTHGTDWLMLVAQWVVDRARVAHMLEDETVELYSCYLDEFLGPKKDDTAPQRKRDRKGDNQAKAIPKQKSKGGRPKKKATEEKQARAPGPFRIYIRQLYADSKGDKDKPPCIKAAAEKYHKLSDQCKKDLIKKAKDAKEEMRRTGKKRVLGMSAKELKSAEKKQRVQQLVSHMEKQHEADTDTQAAPSNAIQTRSIVHRALQDNSIEKIADNHAMVHTAARIVARTANADAEARVRDWHTSVGRSQVQQFINATRIPKFLQKNTIAMVGTHVPSFLFTRDAKHLAMCANYLQTQTRKCNMKRALLDQFHKRCEPILDRDCERILEEPRAASRIRPCLKMMVCLCDEHGPHNPPATWVKVKVVVIVVL